MIAHEINLIKEQTNKISAAAVLLRLVKGCMKQRTWLVMETG